MGLERKGTQFRIRVTSPKRFRRPTIRTLDVGRKGGLKLIIGRRKGKTTTSTQALRVSVKDFKRVGDKLLPKNAKGRSQLKSLMKRKTGAVARAVRRYF